MGLNSIKLWQTPNHPDPQHLHQLLCWHQHLLCLPHRPATCPSTSTCSSTHSCTGPCTSPAGTCPHTSTSTSPPCSRACATTCTSSGTSTGSSTGTSASPHTCSSASSSSSTCSGTSSCSRPAPPNPLNALVKALTNALGQTMQHNHLPIPHFWSGSNEEPHIFKQKALDYMDDTQILAAEHTMKFHLCLKGDARDWYNDLTIPANWDALTTLFCQWFCVFGQT